jgi:hypothetical protein
MLGSGDGGKTIDHFYWDRRADTSRATYSPSVELINKKILPEWNEKGVRLVGFVHSHPKGSISPSGGDAVYAKNLLSALEEERFYLPIVQSGRDGHFKIYGYAAEARENDLPGIHRYELFVPGQSSEGEKQRSQKQEQATIRIIRQGKRESLKRRRYSRNLSARNVKEGSIE